MHRKLLKSAYRKKPAATLLKPENLFILVLLAVVFQISCKRKIDRPDSSSNIHYLQNGQSDVLINAKPTADGGFIYCGKSLESDYNTQGFLLKVDANGKEIWYKKFGDSLIEELYDVTECPDGGFLAVGVTSIPQLPGNLMDYVLKTNAAGELEWSKSFTDGTGSLSKLTSVTVASDGYAYATGNYPSNQVWMTTLVLKFDLNGNLGFLKPIEAVAGYKPNLMPQVDWSSGSDLIVDKDGNIIITTKLVQYQLGGQFPAVLSLSKTGKVNFYYPYLNYSPGGDYTSGGSNLEGQIELVGNGFGYFLAWNNDSNTSSGGRNCILLMHIGLDGKIIWSKKYLADRHCRLNNMSLGTDGNLLISGSSTSETESGPYPESFFHTNGFILKLDTAGNTLCNCSAGGSENGLIFRAAREVSTNKFIAAGALSLNNYGFHKMVFFKNVGCKK